MKGGFHSKRAHPCLGSSTWVRRSGGLRRGWVAPGLGTVLLLWGLLTAPAADVKKGVGPDKISLPSGPGSIEGLGDAFEPQLNSGTSAY